MHLGLLERATKSPSSKDAKQIEQRQRSSSTMPSSIGRMLLSVDCCLSRTDSPFAFSRSVVSILMSGATLVVILSLVEDDSCIVHETCVESFCGCQIYNEYKVRAFAERRRTKLSTHMESTYLNDKLMFNYVFVWCGRDFYWKICQRALSVVCDGWHDFCDSNGGTYYHPDGMARNLTSTRRSR